MRIASIRLRRRAAAACVFSLVCGSASAAIDCTSLDGRLNAMASADQQVRQEGMQQWQDAAASQADKEALRKRWAAVDAANLAELKTIIAACGWPAGSKGSHSAWLLAQHADSDTAFQRSAKVLLEAAVKNGQGAGRDLAYLADRIATSEHRPQEYGTQFQQTDRCSLALLPIDNRDEVNRRRRAVGLQSLEDYEAEGRRRMIPADCAASKTDTMKAPAS